MLPAGLDEKQEANARISAALLALDEDEILAGVIGIASGAIATGAPRLSVASLLLSLLPEQSLSNTQVAAGAATLVAGWVLEGVPTPKGVVDPPKKLDAAIWSEAKHPRDDRGRFGHGSGSLPAGVTRTPPLDSYHKVLLGPDGAFFWKSHNTLHMDVASETSPSYIRYADGDERENAADFAFGEYHTEATRDKPTLELVSDAPQPSPALAKQILDAYGNVDPLPALRFNGPEVEDWDLEFEDLIGGKKDLSFWHPRRASSIADFAGKPVSGEAYVKELAFRALFGVQSIRRITASQDQLKQANRERSYFNAHLRAAKNREINSAVIDDAVGRWGDKLSWRAIIDARTTPECRAANGKNFHVSKPPGIGLPGIGPHPNCRCVPGPPIEGASEI